MPDIGLCVVAAARSAVHYVAFRQYCWASQAYDVSQSDFRKLHCSSCNQGSDIDHAISLSAWNPCSPNVGCLGRVAVHRKVWQDGNCFALARVQQGSLLGRFHLPVTVYPVRDDDRFPAAAQACVVTLELHVQCAFKRHRLKDSSSTDYTSCLLTGALGGRNAYRPRVRSTTESDPASTDLSGI